MTVRLPLTCRFGRHDPDPLPRWNEGYYFARCRRCGADLVRTIYGPWQQPKGFRVIWSHVRPEGTQRAIMLADVDADAPETVQSLAPERRRPSSYVPDFMDDAQTDTSWRRHLPPVAEDTPADGKGATEAKPARADFARLIPPLRRPRAADEDGDRRSARRVVFAVLAFAVLVVSIAALVRNDGAGAAAPPAPQPDPAMFVSDGMISCRAMASPEAAHVRYLVRGDSVRYVGSRGSWAAISYGGQQCWVPLSILSRDPIP